MTLPKYPFWKINPLVRLVGIADYHNGTSWLWIDLLAVELFSNNCKNKLALEKIEQISEIILRDGTIYETYNNNGEIYSTLLWQSAVPFAWNSGIFLEVKEKIENLHKNI